MEIKKTHAYGTLIILVIIIFASIFLAIYYKETIKSYFSTNTEELFDEDLRSIYLNDDVKKTPQITIEVTGLEDGPELAPINEGEFKDDIKVNFANNIDNNLSDYMLLDQINAVDQVNPTNSVVTNTTTSSVKAYDVREQPILQTQSDYYLLDDGAKGSLTFDYNTCSKACCGTKDWPVPFYVPENKVNGENIPTNMFCSNSISNGCLCATPKQIQHLQTRGSNSPY